MVEKGPDIVCVQTGRIARGCDKEEFGQGGLPGTEDVVGLRQDLLRLPLPEGHVALAADCQKERVYARRIYGVDLLDAGKLLWGEAFHDLVDEVAKAGVLLGRPAHDREVPDRVLAVIHVFDLHDGEIVGQGIISQVVAKGPLGLFHALADRARNDKIGIGGQHMPIFARIAKAPAPQHAGKGELGKPLRQRHDRRKGVRGRPSDEDRSPKRLLTGIVLGVVHADAPVDLVVQPNFAVELVFVAA